MRRTVPVLLVMALLGGLAVAGLGLDSAPAASRVTIKADDDFFAPARKSVRRGTLVRWRWVGNNRHNVVKKRGPGRAFASERTAEPGINFKKRFRKRGRYLIVCTIHEEEGMKMRLRVR